MKSTPDFRRDLEVRFWLDMLAVEAESFVAAIRPGGDAVLSVELLLKLMAQTAATMGKAEELVQLLQGPQEPEALIARFQLLHVGV